MPVFLQYCFGKSPGIGSPGAQQISGAQLITCNVEGKKDGNTYCAHCTVSAVCVLMWNSLPAVLLRGVPAPRPKSKRALPEESPVSLSETAGTM